MQLDAQLRINEVMQSNVHGIMDDMNEYPDSWVELYNSGSEKINLADYSLSVDTKSKKAYKLPAQELLPGRFVVLYCDKEGKGLHTSFRVDTGKSEVYLWKNGEIIETVSLAKMPAPDIAWGRASENSDEWGCQAFPSPGAANYGLVTGGLLGDVVFSQSGGICKEPFTLSLSLPEGTPAEAVIRYTVDGSMPTEKSAVYTEPIRIAETTVIRAAAMCGGAYLSPMAATASFIFHDREQTLPIVSLTTDAKNFYDDKIGILVEGSFSADKENFRYDWRRPVNIEYFEQDGTRVLSQVCETRLKGNTTRGLPLKSMVLYANKRFGAKRFEYEFFKEQRPGVTDFKSLEMRNSGQDFNSTYMRDALFQQLLSDGADVDFQAYQPVILYLNGQYKGVINLRERANEDNIYTHYNGLEDIEMVENWRELKAGDGTFFSDFKTFYTQEDHTLDEYAEVMDIDEFTNVMVGNVICNNWDFPANNNIMWRPMENGGKWRWILKDADFSIGLWNFEPEFEYFRFLDERDYRPNPTVIGNAEYGVELYKKLMAITEYKDFFLDNIAVALGSYFSQDTVEAMIDKYSERLASEMEFHRALYPAEKPFLTYVQEMKQWYKKRYDFMFKHTAEYWGLEEAKPFKIVTSENTVLELSINDIKVKGDKFDGRWFPGRKVSVSACPDGDLEIIGWRVTTVNGDDENTYEQTGAVFDAIFPDVDSLLLEPVFDPAGIDYVGSTGEDASVEYFDMQGRSLGSHKPTGGIFLRKAGAKVSKVRL